MAEAKKHKSLTKDVAFRVVKAAFRASLLYIIYFLLVPIVAPLFGMVPGLAGSIEVFVMVYIVLMLLGDLTEHTVFQYFFGTARSLFLIAYLLLNLGDGLFSVGFGNFSLTVNLTLFYGVAVTLSLLGFAKSILQAINFLNERAEATSGLQL